MKPYLIIAAKGLLFGILTEAVLFGLTFALIESGGWGPCGPASRLAEVGAIIQMPGFLLGCNIIGVIVFQSALWSVAWVFWLTWKSFCKSKRKALPPSA